MISPMNAFEALLVALYFVVLAGLFTLGVHRAVMVFLAARSDRRVKAAALPARRFAPDELPVVTVQLPIFNEATVTERLLDAASRIDYPRDRLEIQVLDDSTDETRQIAEAKVAQLREQGLDIHYIRRPSRHGYKAGALDYGLKLARGEFIAMFDADFVPTTTFLRDIIDHFADPQIGMVQTRWAHMNRSVNLMTEVQALMLDGHHLIEDCARFGSDCFFNFAGTGGMWRREAIERAGGWQHDTITEDLDLSYRAQMAGYRFIYRPDILTPAELPEDMSALRQQQHRWAKGTVQTARKLLPTVWEHEPLSLHQKIEASFHMLPHFAYPLMLLLGLLQLPTLLLLKPTDIRTMVLVDLPMCVIATGSIAAFYCYAEAKQGRSIWGAIARLPILIALGAGLSPYLTRAVWAGMNEMSGEFVRTPKKGQGASRYRMSAQLPLAEACLGLLSLAAAFVAIDTGHWFAAPFCALFAWGYAYVATMLVKEQFLSRLGAGETLETPLESAPEATLAKAA